MLMIIIKSTDLVQIFPTVPFNCPFKPKNPYFSLSDAIQGHMMHLAV